MDPICGNLCHLWIEWLSTELHRGSQMEIQSVGIRVICGLNGYPQNFTEVHRWIQSVEIRVICG